MVCLGIQVLYEEVVEVEERLVLHNEKVKLNFFFCSADVALLKCVRDSVCLDRFKKEELKKTCKTWTKQYEFSNPLF